MYNLSTQLAQHALLTNVRLRSQEKKKKKNAFLRIRQVGTVKNFGRGNRKVVGVRICIAPSLLVVPVSEYVLDGR